MGRCGAAGEDRARCCCLAAGFGDPPPPPMMLSIEKLLTRGWWRGEASGAGERVPPRCGLWGARYGELRGKIL